MGGGYGGRGWAGMGGMGRRGGGRGGYPQQTRPDGKKILEQISKQTGARLFEVSKKQPIEQIYDRIQEELRNQYSLGYTPDRPGGAGYHKIHLKTKQKDLTVQARDGYYASAGSDEPVSRGCRRGPDLRKVAATFPRGLRKRPQTWQSALTHREGCYSMGQGYIFLNVSEVRNETGRPRLSGR